MMMVMMYPWSYSQQAKLKEKTTDVAYTQKGDRQQTMMNDE